MNAARFSAIRTDKFAIQNSITYKNKIETPYLTVSSIGSVKSCSSQFYAVENLMRLPLPRSLFPCRSCSTFLFILVLGLAPHVVLAQAPQPVEAIMKKMFSAIENNSLTDFVASGDPAFQSGMTQEILDSIRQPLASRLKQGYTTTFLVKLNQQGFMVYLWKLELKDKSDDILASIAMKDEKVSGFWLR